MLSHPQYIKGLSKYQWREGFRGQGFYSVISPLVERKELKCRVFGLDKGRSYRRGRGKVVIAKSTNLIMSILINKNMHIIYIYTHTHSL